MATIRGVVGQVKWSYHNAAAINGYTVTRTKDTKQWSVRGIAVMTDAFKLRQKPLRFVAPYQGGEWEWMITEFDISAEGIFRAKLQEFPRSK